MVSIDRRSSRRCAPAWLPPVVLESSRLRRATTAASSESIISICTSCFPEFPISNSQLPTTPNSQLPTTPNSQLPTTPNSQLPTTPNSQLPIVRSDLSCELEVGSGWALVVGSWD